MSMIKPRVITNLHYAYTDRVVATLHRDLLIFVDSILYIWMDLSPAGRLITDIYISPEDSKSLIVKIDNVMDEYNTESYTIKCRSGEKLQSLTEIVTTIDGTQHYNDLDNLSIDNIGNINHNKKYISDPVIASSTFDGSFSDDIHEILNQMRRDKNNEH